jgi:diadenosine tetraphosphatase ApaH/serine/threonine PP2A family protein phosphatase
MRMAIMTDLHANREALEACLQHAERRGAQRYVFLGDLVGYGADPAWVVEQVMQKVQEGGLCVRGNHDHGLAFEPSKHMVPDAQRVLEWTRQHLNAQHMAFLRELPYSATDGEMLFVHANAWDPPGWAYVLSVVEAGRSMQATKARIIFCGHVHQPMLYHMGLTRRVESFDPPGGTDIPLSLRRQWLVMPGSVGQPRDGNPTASYVLFDSENHLLTFHRIPYDVHTAARKVREAGLPPKLANRLESGA